MTYLIIHNSKDSRFKTLQKLLHEYLQKEFGTWEEIEKNPDLHLLGRDGESIGIEAAKDFQKTIVFKPFQEKYQIGIIDNSFNLTIEAQNSLLKTLEDQNPSTIFILLVDNEKNLLDTIISRSIKHYVKGKKKEDEDIEKPSVLDLELHDQFSIVETLAKEKNPKINKFLESITLFYRTEMNNALRNDDSEVAEQTREKLEVVQTTKTRLKGNANKRLALENMLLQLDRGL